jgi:hypothetical protein
MASKARGESPEIHELNAYQGSDEDQYHKNVTKGGTAQDSMEMRRMGRAQELRVWIASQWIKTKQAS